MKIDKVIAQFLDDPNYRVSNQGYVYSKYTAQGHPGPWRELKLITKKRYMFVTYKHQKLPMHRVVLMAYGAALPHNVQVNHKDGNPSNNQISNLEVTSQSENNLHRFRTLKYPAVIGNKKLSYEIADQIREESMLGVSYRQLLKKYDVSKTTISYIINNKIWK